MLRLDNISYTYKNSDREVLKNISADFNGSTLYAIVGSSGSGKTTLLSIIAGFDKPKSGMVYFDGEPLSSMDLDVYRRKHVSMIFQSFNLFPLLTALENVCYPMEFNGGPRKKAVLRAKDLLDGVGIGEDKHARYPANLSGGEQQRVAIARSLATGARLLLADEPTGNLDTENGMIVIDILKKLAQEKGYCIIIVTHNPEVADASDIVLRMSDGMIPKLRIKLSHAELKTIKDKQ